ncbi:DUF5132 domain-containing protein [Pannus brasiliensis CCIBt3594]|uniref:DUF5132 domain-containing protein n=1 Tax=Pannus brasiliensis CCIBt3594 TaxID=1427578 RepID=A0AAW9QZG4_9CHRO
MEELLLLGAGVVAVAVAAPIIGSLINPELGQAIADSGRNLVKEGLKLGMDATEQVQTSIAEVNESWNDLVAEAKAERMSTNNARPIQNIEIVSE